MGIIHNNLIQSLINFRNKYLTASDNLIFKFTKDSVTGKYGYLDINGKFIPFRTTHIQTKTVSSETTAQTVDMGEDHEYRYVSVSAITPQRTAGTAATTSGTDREGPYVYFPYGWYPNVNATYGCYVRMTAAQAQATHSHTGTRAKVTSNGTIDLGEKHNIRYVPVGVPNSAVTIEVIMTASVDGNNAGVTSVDLNSVTGAVSNYNNYIQLSGSTNKALSYGKLTYSSPNAKFTFSRNVYCNGTAYSSGQSITWSYSTRVARVIVPR